MRIAIIQNDPVFGDREGNASRLTEQMRTEAKKHPDDPPLLYVLPELCCTGYQFKSREEALSLAEKPQCGVSIDILRDCARSLGAAIVFGFPEIGPSDGEKLYNSALLLGPEGNLGVYRKTHLFYKEKSIFDPGNSGFQVFSWKGINIGIAICFDWFFPEAFRSLALKGAELIAHPANLVLPYCQRADFARAVENRVYIATANRCGMEERAGERLEYSGESVALSPQGDYLLRLAVDSEASGSFEIDPESARNKRINPHNDLFEDRRPEFYC